MHPSVFVVLGTVTAGVIFLFLNRRSLREGEVHEACHVMNPSTHSGHRTAGSVITAQKAGADCSAAQAMLNEVESRLKKIRRIEGEDEKRRVIESLRSHFSPLQVAGTPMEATFQLISDHIEQRLVGMGLSDLSA